MTGYAGRRISGSTPAGKSGDTQTASPASADNEHVHSRYLVLGAAVWAAGFTGIYIVIVRGQGNSPAWWYVALLATGTGVLALAAAGRRPRLP